MNPELPLRDIHAAAGASWWPLSPLMWVLVVLLLVLIAVVLAIVIRRWLRARRKRAMLANLQQLQSDYDQHQDRSRLAQDLSQWLRRLLLFRSSASQVDVAALTGQQWGYRLAAPFADNARLRAAADQIAQQPWRAQPDFDEQAAFELARSWVTHLSRAGHV